MFANTYRLYYRQGAMSFYTVDDYGSLHPVRLDIVMHVIHGMRADI